MVDKGKGLQKNTPAYLRAKNNGFGKAGVAGRPRSTGEELTENIETAAMEHEQILTQMALQALRDGMASKDIKIRVDAAKKYLTQFHQPRKQVDIDVTDHTQISDSTFKAAESMTSEERELVDSFLANLRSLRSETIVDAEVIEETDG